MKKSLLTILLAIVCTVLSAGDITRKEARQRAATILSHSADVQLVATGGDRPAYYVFNAQQKDKGFVIVAGIDDVGDGILGYSDSGWFDPQDMPPALEYWLESYAQQVELIRSGRATAYRAPKTHAAIEPWVKTQWNQEAPYNLQLPVNPVTQSRFAHTGCLAVAIAQILKFWSYSEPSADLPAYSYKYQYQDSIGQVQVATVAVPALESATFDYSKMLDSYSSDYSEESANEVAKLMRYCGQAAKMNYYDNESSAATNGDIFCNYFGYNTNYGQEERDTYSSEEWDSLIYSELQAGRPVIYSGSKYNGSGHSFICDGYKDGLYHLNWGWGGHYDGYFKLSEANSYGTGTGAGNGLDGYSFAQEALIRICPQQLQPQEASPAMTVAAMSTTATSLTRTSGYFTIPVTFTVWNYTGQQQTFDTGVGVYSDGKLVQSYLFSSNTFPHASGFMDKTLNIRFGEGVTSGQYTVYAISRQSGGDWRIDNNSTANHITLTISGNTLTAVGTTDQLQVNSVALDGVKKSGATITLTANITNTGDMNTSAVYLFVNGSLSTGVGVNLSAGETDDVVMHFRASTTGTIPLRLCMDKEGTRQLWSGSVEIAERVTPNIAIANVQVPNAVADYTLGQMVLRSTEIQYSAEIENKADAEYSDFIIAYLGRGSADGSGRFSLISRALHEVHIAAGKKAVVSGLFDGLEAGREYVVFFYAYDADGSEKMVGNTYAYLVQDPTSDVSSVAADGHRQPAPVYSLGGSRVGTTADRLPKGVYIVKGRKFVVK